MQVRGPKTVFYRIRVSQSARTLGRGRVVSLYVRNPLTNAVGTGNTTTILVGDSQTQLFDLLPGSITPEIFAADLKDISVRVLNIPLAPNTDCDCVVVAHREPEPVRNTR